MNFKLFSIAGFVAAAMMACMPSQPSQKSFAQLMVNSEVTRNPNPVTLGFHTGPRWDYCAATEMLALLRLGQQTADSSLLAYVEQWGDSLVADDGTIYKYRKDIYNIDHVCPGRLMLKLYKMTGRQKFLTACDTLWSQMLTHPRTSEGGFWHKKVYPHQMWLDGLFMGTPFLTEYANLKGIDNADDIARQFIIVARHTYDDSTKLYRHAWDESREMFWADPVTGQSQHAWGRANGWYMMAMAEVLEILPQQCALRDSVVQIFNGLAHAVLNYSDPQTEMWYQVLDSPSRHGNFLESSCSAMFIYSMLKGARLGVLPQEFDSIGHHRLHQFINTFVKVDNDSVPNAEKIISVTNCCAVAGLGGKSRRDGSFDYYIHEAVRDNDPKTVGPFIMACLEAGL